MMRNTKIERIFEYGQIDFTGVAVTALDQDDPAAITVAADSAPLVERAIRAHDAYFHDRRNGRRALGLLFRFGLLAFRTLTLWPVLNKAELQGRSVVLERRGAELTIHLSNRGSG